MLALCERIFIERHPEFGTIESLLPKSKVNVADERRYIMTYGDFETPPVTLEYVLGFLRIYTPAELGIGIREA